MKPRLLDLFCCAGGAARGYQRAGFHVTGVDIEPRPNYCGDGFIQTDAIDYLQHLAIRKRRNWPLPYNAVHASCPCQEGCTLTNGTNESRGWGGEHRQLVPPTRAYLQEIGLPYVIEQPAGHGGLIRNDLTLCMDMFPVDPPRVFRHRDFEIGGFFCLQPPHVKHTGKVRAWHGANQGGNGRPAYYEPGDGYVAAYGDGGDKATVAEMQHALGIDWTDVREELTEAIPPAYTQFIGEQLLAQLGTEVAA